MLFRQVTRFSNAATRISQCRPAIHRLLLWRPIVLSMASAPAAGPGADTSPRELDRHNPRIISVVVADERVNAGTIAKTDDEWMAQGGSMRLRETGWHKTHFREENICPTKLDQRRTRLLRTHTRPFAR